MKNHLTVIFAVLILLPQVLHAQKLRNKRAEVKYVSLPSEVLPAEFMTYSVEVQGHNNNASMIKMDGFKRLPSEGHLRIVVNTSYPDVGKGKYTSETRTTKDKDGKETKTTYHWYNFPVGCYTSFRILDPEGNVLASGKQNNTGTDKSSESRDYKWLSKNYSKMYNEAKQTLGKRSAAKIFKAAQNALDTKFDFDLRSTGPQVHSIRKHDTEAQFESNLDKTLAVFKEASHYSTADELQEQLKEPTEFWKTQLQDTYRGDKKLSRIYVAAGLNLAVVSLYLDQFDLAEEYAQLVLAEDPKEKEAKRIVERIAKLRPGMKAHDIYSMHHYRNLEEAKPPSELAAFEEMQEELEEESESSIGKVVLLGEELSGKIYVDKDADDFIFGENGNVKFLISENSEIEEIDLAHPDVESFAINDRVFKKMKFTPRAKGDSEEGMHILEEVYISEKINLYKYYPVGSSLSDATQEYIFMKGADDALVSLYDTQFLILKKGLANYFSDCADLQEMCNEGAFAMQGDDLVKAARIYSEVCE